jgi:hypothetical protein
VTAFWWLAWQWYAHVALLGRSTALHGGRIVVVFRCPRCGATSPDPTAIDEGYCGRCHDWTGQT